MNEKQKQWAQSRCDELKQYMDQHVPLSEAQWDSVADYIKKIVDLAKGNGEVRDMLFDLIEPYQKKTEEMM